MSMVVRCPGCTAVVSEWASHCSLCGADLADAEVLAAEDPRPHGRESARPGSGRFRARRTQGGMAAAVAVVVAAAVVTVLGVWPVQSSRRQTIFSRPTTRSPNTARSPVRSSGALRVGPLTFHPMPFANDGLVAVVLHPVAVVPPGLTLSGWECGDGRPLRFWYQSFSAMGFATRQAQPSRPGGSVGGRRPTPGRRGRSAGLHAVQRAGPLERRGSRTCSHSGQHRVHRVGVGGTPSTATIAGLDA